MLKHIFIVRLQFHLCKVIFVVCAEGEWELYVFIQSNLFEYDLVTHQEP